MAAHEGAGHLVALIHVGQRVAAAEAVAVHDGFHQAADVEETDLVFEEELDGFFVGAIGGAGAKAALLDGLFAGRKAAEGLFVCHIEGQHLEGGEIQLRHHARHTGRVGQRVLDGDAHIGHAQLRNDGVVAVLDGGVDDALALDDDLDLLRGQTEQPDGFDQFQTLIHQGGRVDGDLRTHVPVGVLQGVGLGLAPQLLGLHPEEGAAGCGEQDLGQALGALLILQALEDGGVLAVHGQQLDAVLCHCLCDQMAAGDKALLVGKGEVVAALDGGQAGPQTGDAHHTVQHYVRAIHGRQFLQALRAGQQLGRVGAARQRGIQLGGGIGVRHTDVFRVKFLDLLQNLVHMTVGRQTEDLIALCADDIQTLRADGTGGAQKRNFFRHRVSS